MNWKEFLKFSGWKLLSVILLLLLSFFISVITLFAAMDVTSNAASVLLYVTHAVAPFSTMSYFFNLSFLGLFLNIFYFYFIACIFSYAINHPEKRKLFIFIGISVIIVMIIFGTISYFFWNKAYVDMVHKGLKEQEEGPYGSSKYLQDVWILNNARTMINQNRLNEALSSCNNLNPEATFNNGENIKEKCLSELQAKKDKVV